MNMRVGDCLHLDVQIVGELEVTLMSRVQKEPFKSPATLWLDIYWDEDYDSSCPSINTDRGLLAGFLVGHLVERERPHGARWCGLSLNLDEHHPAWLGTEAISLADHLALVQRMGGMYGTLEKLPPELLETVGETKIYNPFVV